MNRILSLAKSEYFAVFDADSSVDKDYLKKALSYFTNDNVAAVASQIKVRNPRTLIEKIQRVEMLFGSFMRRLMLLIGTQHFTNGVMSLFRTDILRSVGGFSDKVMTEDLEIAIRLRSLGYDVRICEDAYGYTKMPNTFKGLWIQRVRWYRGFIQSYLLHRKMLGNKSFGLLGLFQLPLGVFSLVIVLLSALVLIYQLFDFLYKQFNWLIGIEGHIFSDFNLPKFSDFLFGMNFKVLFPALVAIFIGLYLYIKAHRHMGEKWKYTISSMIYIFLYPVLLGLQLWHACFAEIFRMKRRWR
jgi:cellulose synthase/poly-beta-1,6-N-acetylglucosamine synthase-like glycosyltransferase